MPADNRAVTFPDLVGENATRGSRSRGSATRALIAVIALFLPAATSQARDLSLDERIKAQEAIERIYYSHQIGATRPFEEKISRAVLEKQVKTYLKQSVALRSFWKTPVTSEMLRKELERMAAHTRMPDRLRELYTALGDDPLVIQECLARPALVDRLARGFFAHDATLHTKARHEAEVLREDLAGGRQNPRDEHPRRNVIRLVRFSADQATQGAEDGIHSGPGRMNEIRLDADAFDGYTRQLPRRVGEVGPVEEEPEVFVTRVVLERSAGEVTVAAFIAPKLSWDRWWASVEDGLDVRSVDAVATAITPLPVPQSDRSKVIASTSCPGPDTWDNGSLEGIVAPRSFSTAVWTGALMVVWGGYDGSSWRNSGGRYDPATDTWTPTSTTNAPAARSGHSAVWTGSLMIVWGGHGPSYFNSGGRYDPATDTWSATSTTSAPTGRDGHTAVWTGSVMVVWGGSNLDTGGRYDPATDTWTATSMTGAPSPRSGHTAVWTGSLMIIWGGGDAVSQLSTGARYDPAADTWTPTSMTGAPVPQSGHTSAWTGSVMLVWGGSYPINGGRYDPATDTWTPMSTINAPAYRTGPSGVWTGSRLIVWGGFDGQNPLNSGGRYDPATDTWTATSTINAPGARTGHAAAWSGSLMIVWGGYFGGGGGSSSLDSGGRYDPVTDTWTPTATTGAPGAPSGRFNHTAIWTGTLMVVWGGNPYPVANTGGRYDPTTDSWTQTSTLNAPSGRSYHTAVWTGDLMIVWGGYDGTGPLAVNTGGRYDPATDTWTQTSTFGAPSGRSNHTAVWTGSLMIVWGGDNDGSPSVHTNTGGRYDPVSNSWASTSTTNAPSVRSYHTAVWTGHLMIVWGGYSPETSDYETAKGGRYDPDADTWTPTSLSGTPCGRLGHTAVWTGSMMIVWGGNGAYRCAENTGGRYQPDTDTWAPISSTNGPVVTYGPTAIWTGDLMIVWGGQNTYYYPVNSGAMYDPASDTWTATSLTEAPSGRYWHSAVWTGSEMIVWGGTWALATGGAFQPGLANPSDGDGDGFSVCQGDCNDADPSIHPGASELCDGRDNDCDGSVDGYVVFCGTGQCSRSGSCVLGISSCLPGPPSTETCDGIDNDCDGTADNAIPPGGSLVLTIDLSAQGPVLTWTPLPDATTYDVVEGDLVTLRSTGGDFSSAIQQCWVNDTTATSVPLPAGAGAFYVVRGSNCGGPGTYDSGDPAQVGYRDEGIHASPLACAPNCGDGICDGSEYCGTCYWDCCPGPMTRSETIHRPVPLTTTKLGGECAGGS